MKTCKKCGERKALSAFHLKSRMADDDRHSACKVCRKVARNEWAKENPEATKAHRDKWRKNNPEYVKRGLAKYREENPEKIKVSNAKWRRENPEAVKVNNAKHKVKQREQRQIDTYGKVMDDPLLMHKDRYRHARALGYRSGLELQVAQELTDANVAFQYEPYRIKYEQPAKTRTYVPDFVLPNDIIIELKGRFPTADRQKMLMVKASRPDLDIRFIFSNPNTRIGKKSSTTYAMWCDKNDFPYAKAATKAQLRAGMSSIPKEWLL